MNRETIEGEPMGAYFEQVMREIGLVDKIEAHGKERGERAKAQQAVLDVLEARFKSVPMGTRKSVDLIALKSLLLHAAMCPSVKEFKEALVR
jgi:hypothetical protein